MKIAAILPLSIANFYAFSIMGHNMVMALSKKQDVLVVNTCSELQAVANRVWKGSISFQGFENLPIDRNATISNAGYDRLCQLGYITKTTPMGKEVCRGYIYLNVKTRDIYSAYGFRQRTIWDEPGVKSEYCRYIN
jgi:hypothetical protein